MAVSLITESLPMNLNMQSKWNRIYATAPATEPEPARVLVENAHLLPASGTALDLACGLGGNALFLARRGLQVTAWDISSVAIQQLSTRATGLTLNAATRDVENEAFPCCAFDVIVVSRFLNRALNQAIIDSLKPQGLLFYQTYTRDKLNPGGPNNPDYLLAENELLRLFSQLRVVVYREESRMGDVRLGFRDEAYFVGRR